MPEIGVRELKARASEILRNLRKRRARYIITYRGRPVALLAPLEEVPADSATGEEAWDELTRLGEAISHQWQSPRTSAELLSEMRR